MKTYESLAETLAFYGVSCNKPYYISSGNPIVAFPKKSFRIDFYAFCICVEGYIELEIDTHQYNITQHGFLVSAPSTIIKFKTTSKNFRMRLLFFDKAFLVKNFANAYIIDKLHLFREGTYTITAANATETIPLFSLLDYLQQKLLVKGKFIEEIVRAIIFNLLLEIAEIVSLKDANQEERGQERKELFLKFDELVKQNIQLHKDVKFYADTLHVSDKYLIQLVKKAAGKPPHQVIDEALLKEAYVMLGNPAFNITQIADELQFSSVSAFGRFFKKHASVSPSQYRSQQNIL
jgi:AraC family 4-hydroxyphenylacetate 3-monooxygenase operon regulatory protein